MAWEAMAWKFLLQRQYHSLKYQISFTAPGPGLWGQKEAVRSIRTWQSEGMQAIPTSLNYLPSKLNTIKAKNFGMPTKSKQYARNIMLP